MEEAFTLVSNQVSRMNGSGVGNTLIKAVGLKADKYVIDGSVTPYITKKFDALTNPHDVYVNAMWDISNALTDFGYFMGEKVDHKEEGRLVNHTKYLVDNHKDAMI